MQDVLFLEKISKEDFDREISSLMNHQPQEVCLFMKMMEKCFMKFPMVEFMKRIVNH